jgi:hypothetical protein
LDRCAKGAHLDTTTRRAGTAQRAARVVRSQPGSGRSERRNMARSLGENIVKNFLNDFVSGLSIE